MLQEFANVCEDAAQQIRYEVKSGNVLLDATIGDLRTLLTSPPPAMQPVNALETLTREILKGHSFASIANIDRELGHSLGQALKAIGTARHKSITGTDWMSVLES